MAKLVEVKALVDFYDVHARTQRKKDSKFKVEEPRAKALTKKVKGKSACEVVK